MRILLFAATNLAILVLLSVVITLFGLDRAMHQNLQSLLIMAAVLGMGGSFFSLAISKWMAKRATGAQVISEPRTEEERWLLGVVQRHAQASGIGTPEVAI